MISNISNVGDYNSQNNMPYTVLAAWSTWSDSSVSSSKMSSCSSPAKDRWVENATLCPSGYTYYPMASAPSASSGSQVCLLLSDWNVNDVNTRYASYSGCSGNGDFVNPQIANRQYFSAVSKYVSDNTILLNQLIIGNNGLNTSMVGTMSQLVRLINDTMNLIDPLIVITNKLVGNSSFYDMINCRFIGQDLYNFISVFSNQFGGSARNLGIMLCTACFLNAVCIIATLFFINYSKDEEGGNKVGEEKKGDFTESRKLAE